MLCINNHLKPFLQGRRSQQCRIYVNEIEASNGAPYIPLVCFRLSPRNYGNLVCISSSSSSRHSNPRYSLVLRLGKSRTKMFQPRQQQPALIAAIRLSQIMLGARKFYNQLKISVSNTNTSSEIKGFVSDNVLMYI